MGLAGADWMVCWAILTPWKGLQSVEAGAEPVVSKLSRLQADLLETLYLFGSVLRPGDVRAALPEMPHFGRVSPELQEAYPGSRPPSLPSSHSRSTPRAERGSMLLRIRAGYRYRSVQESGEPQSRLRPDYCLSRDATGW